jgi:hypothetical protein
VPDLSATHPARLLECALDLCERSRRLPEQRLARIRQANASLGAREELDSQLAFELLDRATESRLRDVQASRGAAEVQLLGDGDEVAQEAEVGNAWKLSIEQN